MAMGVWPDDYYPSVRHKLASEFASEFNRLRDIDKLKSDRKRRRPPCSDSSSPRPYIQPEKPVYTDDILTRFPPLGISVGKPLDLVSLLLPNPCDHAHHTTTTHLFRNHHHHHHDSCCFVQDIGGCFNGKHVLVICFFVPVRMHFDFGALRMLEFSLFINEMYSNYPANFEAVLVVKMKPNWANNQAVFRHFLSGFPPSCLVVPFEDTTRIDAICRSLNLQATHKGVVVDRNGVVVQDSLKLVGSVDLIDSFPYRYTFPRKCETWHNKSLVQLLGSGELKRCCPSPDGTVSSTSVSELANKRVVGLYLCGIGQDISVLHKVYTECQTQQLDFEVVLVYVPSIRHYPPDIIEDVIASFLCDNDIPFWVSPFNYTVSLRLYHLAECFLTDKLLIVVNGQLKEIDGELFIYSLGSSGYPFDRESLIQRALGELEKLTLESLLEGGSLRRGNKASEEVSVSCLKGKNVVLFLGGAVRGKGLYELIEEHYDEIKAKHGGFEVVFVCIDDTISATMEERMSCMRWLVYHPDECRPQPVMKELSLWGRRPDVSMIAFGADGKISSLDAEDVLKLNGSDAFPFWGDMHRQVGARLNELLVSFRNRIRTNP